MRDMEIVVVKRVKRSAKVAKRVAERRAKGMCIACGEFPPNRREICDRCYSRFQMHRPSRDMPLKRAKYEASMLAEGLIGENRQGERPPLQIYRALASRSEE